MDPAPDAQQLRLIRWSEGQAVAMLAVIALALAGAPLFVAVAVSAASFACLIGIQRNRWTPRGAFGAANAATLLRFLIILGLLAWPGLATPARLALALAALGLDGVDGWLARHLGLCSEFGEYFDQEVDAVFTLALGLMLVREGLLGPWILIPGGLRYGFILFVKFARPPRIKATGTFLGKAICVGVIAALLICLLPLPPLRAPLALTATIVLCGSFAWSIRGMYRPG